MAGRKHRFTWSAANAGSRRQPENRIYRSFFRFFWRRWQEWQGSNLRPPVLETGALPIELHSYWPPL
jgi:hypothetical protein